MPQTARILKAITLVSTIGAILAACSPAPTHLSAYEKSSLRREPAITVVVFAPTPVLGTNAGGSREFDGVFGTGAWSGDGLGLNSFLVHHGIRDPGSEFALRLQQHFRDQAGLANLVLAPKTASFLDHREYEARAAYLKATFHDGIVLQVVPETIGLYRYNPFSKDYYTRYGFLVEVTDTASGDLIWRSWCKAGREDRAQPPTLEDFRRNQFALLRDWFSESADTCAQQIVNEFLASAP